MLDKLVTKIEETVKEMMMLEEKMKHNIYMRGIAITEEGYYDTEDRDMYVENLLVEFEVLHKRHEELDTFLREFCMSMYMSEK